MKKKKRSLLNRILNATCFLSILVSYLYLIFLGFNLFASGIIVGAIIITSIPVVMAGEGTFDILSGILEAVVDGALAVIEGIASIFNL